MAYATRPVDDERVYRVLMANTQDAVFIVGLNFEVLRVNERAVSMYGFPADGLIGQSITHILTPDEQDLLRRAVDGESLPLIEREMHRRDGSPFTGQVNLLVVPDANNQPLYFLAIVRDVSERAARVRALDESQRLFAGIAHMLPGIIHILDLVENRTVFVNRELIDLLGYTTDVPDGVGDRLMTTLIHPDDRAHVGADFARLRHAADHEVVEGEYRVQTADGRWRWLYSRSNVFTREANGVPRQIVSVLIDIDDRKRETERRRAELERMKLVNDIATVTAADLPDDAFAQHVVAALHTRYPNFRAVLAALEGDVLQVRASREPEGILSLTGKQMPLNPRPEFRAALEQFQPLVISNAAAPDAPPVPSLAGIRAMLSAPLRRGDTLIGLLSLHSPEPHVWAQEDIETLRECAAYVSAALSASEARRERQKTEAALRESERRYRMLIDHFPDGAVLMFDHDLRYIVAGGSVLSRVDLYTEVMVGRTIYDVFSEHVQSMLEPYYRRALAGEALSFETAWSKGYYVTHLLPVHDEDGRIVGGLSVVADLTERRRLEEAQRLNEERYRQVVEDQTELICRFVSGGKLTFVNEAYCRYLNVRREDVIGQSFLPKIFDADRERIESMLNALGADNQTARAVQRTVMPDGSVRWQEWINRVILDAAGSIVEYQGVGRDITDQLKAEEALAEKTHLLQTVIDSLPDFIYVKDREGHVLLDNIPHARSLNAVPADIVGKTDYDLFPLDLADGYARDDQQVIESGVPLINREEISISTEGERVWAVTSKVPFRNAKGEIIGLIGQTHDISKRKSAEDELQRERDFTQTILDTTAALMIVVDTEGRILSFNRACERLSGYSADEVKGIPFWDIYIVPEEYDRVRAAFAQLYDGAAPMNHNINYWQVRDGRRILLEWINTAVHRADGSIQYIISSGIDITERKQLEERNLELAVERERIRFLNDFVRNVSHDLRTPLSVLNTSLYLMRKVSDPARQAERMDTMKEQVDRLTRLIEQLMTMSRLDNEVEYLPVDLCSLTRATVASFERLAASRSLTLTLRADDESLDVLGDDTQLTIAVSNLLENELQYARTRVELRLFRSADRAIIELSDDGPGIPASELAHIFDRFYRADKARSAETGGTGLGLSIAQKIVDNHGGRIDVETEVGRGTSFRVTLPLASQNA